MVLVNKETDLIKLIEDPDSTVDDINKYFTLMPEKFKSILESEKGLDLFTSVIINNKISILHYIINRVVQLNIKIDITKLLYLLVNLEPNIIQEIIQYFDISKVKDGDKMNIITQIIDNTKEFEDALAKLYVLVTSSNGAFNIYDTYIDSRNADYIPIIWLFIRSHNIERFKYVMEKLNKNINYRYRHKRLIDIALDNNNYNVAKYLLNKWTNPLNYWLPPNVVSYMNYINVSILPSDKIKFIKLFIEHGLDIDAPINKAKDTLLMYSISNNNKELFDFALENNANVNHILENLRTPLSYTLLIWHKRGGNNKYFIQKLIDKHVDVNKPIGEYNTPTFFVAIKNKLDIKVVKMLIDAGADKDTKIPNINSTALEYSLTNYETDIPYYSKLIKLLGGEVPKKNYGKDFQELILKH